MPKQIVKLQIFLIQDLWGDEDPDRQHATTPDMNKF